MDRVVGFDGRPTPCRLDPLVEIALDRIHIFTLDQAPVCGLIEQFVDGAQILADLIGLPDDVA